MTKRENEQTNTNRQTRTPTRTRSRTDEHDQEHEHEQTNNRIQKEGEMKWYKDPMIEWFNGEDGASYQRNSNPDPGST